MTTTTTSKKYNWPSIIIPSAFIFIYFQIFTADFAYLDEAHQLWNNDNQTNFDMFATQGRFLTGVLFKILFGAISTIEQIKYLRIFSFLGWIGVAFAWSRIFKKWIGIYGWDKRIGTITDCFIASCAAVAVYIGWASCFEVFLGIAAGMYSGHLFYLEMHNQSNGIKLRWSRITLSLFLGIVALFIYQTAFGMFLVPFVFHYLNRKVAKPDKMIERAVIFYIVVYIVYYFLYKYSLTALTLQASTRTNIHIDPLKKLSFLLSGPIPPAFSLNILYRGGSIIVQIWQYLVMGFWIFSVFKRSRETSVVSKVTFIVIVFVLLALIYLPLLIVDENFASYRSLFAFNLFIFVMVAEAAISFVKTEKYKKVFSLSLICALLVVGFYNFNIQYINPLKSEYQIVRTFFGKNYQSEVEDIHFIRAKKNLFKEVFSISSFKDEFGTPSTSRDWVPEPLVKQLIYEETRNRSVSQQTKVVQYENSDLFNQGMRNPDSTLLIIDINDLMIK